MTHERVLGVERRKVEQLIALTALGHDLIRTMFREIEADCYLMIDGDDTYPAESAREMVDLVLNKKVDMVVGDRLSATYYTENKRPFHNLGARITVPNGLKSVRIRGRKTQNNSLYSYFQREPL